MVSGGHYQRALVTQHVHSLAHSLGEGHSFVQSFGRAVLLVGSFYVATWVSQLVCTLVSALSPANHKGLYQG